MSYDDLLREAVASGDSIVEYLRREIPPIWLHEYIESSSRRTNAIVFTHGTFDYLYDDYATLEATGIVEPDNVTEARLVGAIGISQPLRRPRDDGRLRGWVGPTGATFGDGWDKGHFIAHSIGGAVDGLEANVLLQRRTVNRGAYKTMENYCRANPGILCFSRPLYRDASALPTQVEFGILKPSNEWWIGLFANA